MKYYIATKAHEALWPKGVILWWGPNRGGYSTTLEMAGEYEEKEAKSICSLRPGQEFMVPCSSAEKLAVRVVDIDRLHEAVILLPSAGSSND